MAVTLKSGPASNDVNLAGMTVEQVREDYGSVFNIPEDATATINGEAASDDTVLRDGDEIVFSKPSGQKGQ